jgi:hypothetical protein
MLRIAQCIYPALHIASKQHDHATSADIAIFFAPTLSNFCNAINRHATVPFERHGRATHRTVGLDAIVRVIGKPQLASMTAFRASVHIQDAAFRYHDLSVPLPACGRYQLPFGARFSLGRQLSFDVIAEVHHKKPRIDYRADGQQQCDSRYR